MYGGQMLAGYPPKFVSNAHVKLKGTLLTCTTTVGQRALGKLKNLHWNNSFPGG